MAQLSEREVAQLKLEDHTRAYNREQGNLFNARQEELKAIREYRDAKTAWEIAEASAKARRSEYLKAKKEHEEEYSGIGGAINVAVSHLMDNELTLLEGLVRDHWVLRSKAEAAAKAAHRKMWRARKRLSEAQSDVSRAERRSNWHQSQMRRYSQILDDLSDQEGTGSSNGSSEDAVNNLNNLFGEWNNLIRENQNSLRDKTREANQEDEVIRKEQNPDSLEESQSNGGNMNNNAHPCPPYCS